MKKTLFSLAGISFLALVLVAFLAPTPTADAAFKICRGNFECLDVYDPVVCDGGVVFSNACYAARACATGCVPSGGALE